ncbi:MAG TPA: restriction endonuclease subunit R, partial [Aequorivita sp.]|nr:restriction endonuclease subunit R [Aequorivita sp.]
IEVILQDRLTVGKERLDSALEEIHLLCEPVPVPKDTLAYIHYFCGNTESEEELKARETQRTALYKKTVALIRAYANIADEMEDAGYTLKEIEGIKKEIDYYLKLREEIRRASGETLDLKSYEADMRHLIDTYIQADDSIKVSAFDNMPLLDIIVNSGMADAINSLPNGIKKDQGAIAETIENNVRSKIIKDHLIDPAFFEEMSKLLDTIIQQRKANAITYAEYLDKIAFIAKTVKDGKNQSTPDVLKTQGQRAIYNNTGKDEYLAVQLDNAIKQVKRDGWRGNLAKEREIKAEIFKQIMQYSAESGIDVANEPPEPYGIENKVEAIFNLIKAQQEY